jgi:hypothetical protein
MSPIHIGAGIVIGGAVIAFLAVLQFSTSPDAQRLAVANEFADARCVMEFYDGAREEFSVRKSDTKRQTYRAPRPGFITMRCHTASKTIESPAGFHLRNGELATVTLKEDGTSELKFQRGAMR